MMLWLEVKKKSPDGNKIIGTFKDGELNGEGELILSWGTIEGVFNLGNPVKAIASDKDYDARNTISSSSSS